MDKNHCTIDDVRQALAFIDCESRDTWVQMAMAVKSEFGDAGFDAWDQWSSAGSTYKAKTARDVWRSVKGAGGVGIGSLLKLAVDAGYQFSPRTADDERRLSAEADARRANRALELAAEEARAAMMQRAVSAMSAALWENFLQPVGRSKYLGAKRVGAYGVRFGRDSVITRMDRAIGEWEIVAGQQAVMAFFEAHKQYQGVDPDDVPYSFRHIKSGTMAVPLRDSAFVLWSLQLIFPAGSKSFFYEGRKQGLFHLIGLPPAPSDDKGLLWIAEGYSTAATVHEATGCPVAMAVDSGNLPAVARALREAFPDSRIAIAADNDSGTAGNPGVTKAREAALAVGGVVVVPVFDVVAA